MKCFQLIISVLLILLMCSSIYRYVKYTNLLKKETKRIKVRRDLQARRISLVNALLWVVIFADKIDSLLIGCFWMLWIIGAVLCVLDLTKYRYLYITPKGVYYPDNFYASEKCSYEINDEKIIFHYKELWTMKMYPLTENREQLSQMLMENYKPYKQNEI